MAGSIASLFCVPCCLTFLHQYYEGSFSFQITLDKPKRRQRREEKGEREGGGGDGNNSNEKKNCCPRVGQTNLMLMEDWVKAGGVSCTPLTPALKGTEIRGSLGLAGYQHR